MKQILLAVISLSFFLGCKKTEDTHGGNQITPPVKAYTCYLSTVEDFNHVVTDRFTYNDNHFLTKLEKYDNNFLRDSYLYYQNEAEHWIREDHFAADGNKNYYGSYKKFYFNSDDKIDSMQEFTCVDCEKENPTAFTLSNYYTYQYDDSLRLLKAQYYSLPHTENGYVNFEYDDLGRMSQESTFSQNGTLAFYYSYSYPDDVDSVLLTGEPSAINKGLYGYSRSYREDFVTYYTSTTGKTQTVHWLNEPNPDGYVNSSANADLSSLKTYYKFACFKN